MDLGYQCSFYHYINVALRAVQMIVEASQCTGTIVHGTTRPPGPWLLAIHTVPPLKDVQYICLFFQYFLNSLLA